MSRQGQSRGCVLGRATGFEAGFWSRRGWGLRRVGTSAPKLGRGGGSVTLVRGPVSAAAGPDFRGSGDRRLLDDETSSTNGDWGPSPGPAHPRRADPAFEWRGLEVGVWGTSAAGGHAAWPACSG